MVKQIAAALLAALLVLGAAGCAPEPDPSGISKTEYDKLELDMWKFDVDNIINANSDNYHTWYTGDKTSERKKDEHTYIHVYEYKGEITGRAILTFEEYRPNPKNEATMDLIEKQQEGLQ